MDVNSVRTRSRVRIYNHKRDALKNKAREFQKQTQRGGRSLSHGRWPATVTTWWSSWSISWSDSPAAMPFWRRRQDAPAPN